MADTARTASAVAPGRVNLIGEHTDYNDGFVLPMALERRCRADVRAVDEATISVRSVQHDGTAHVPLDAVRPGANWVDGPDGWAAYAIGVAWAFRERGHLDTLPGLAVDLDSDVPLGSGLSSSAAVCCSVALALSRLFGLDVDRRELVAVTRVAENDIVGAPTGGMDQLASLMCTAGNLLLCDMRSLDVEQVPFTPRAAGLALLMLDSRIRHQHAGGAYGERRAACEQAARELGVPALRDIELADLPAALEQLSSDVLRRRARHVVTEDDRVQRVAALLRDGRTADIGPLLTASHASMRDDFEITTPEIDAAVEALLEAGALGARMTGGGFGGYVLALVPADGVEQAGQAVARSFAADGLDAPTWFVAEPSEGARLSSME